MPSSKKQTGSILMVSLLFLSVFTTSYCFAESPVLTPGDFLEQVLAAIERFGGLSWVLKISVAITLIIASMKVSFLNRLIWQKLGNFRAWAAPILGIIAGVLSLATDGAPITLAKIFAFLSAGAGAIILHELLDTIKGIPGLGEVWIGLIDMIEKVLGGPAADKGAKK